MLRTIRQTEPGQVGILQEKHGFLLSCVDSIVSGTLGARLTQKIRNSTMIFR